MILISMLVISCEEKKNCIIAHKHCLTSATMHLDKRKKNKLHADFDNLKQIKLAFKEKEDRPLLQNFI